MSLAIQFLASIFILITLSGCGVDLGNTSKNLATSSLSSSNGGPLAKCPDGIAWQYPKVSTLSANVLNFSRRNYGKTVGNGECADLANIALRTYGAKSFDTTGGPTGLNADYVWGTLVSEVNPGRIPLGVLPGDIVQFKGAKFQWQSGSTTVTSTADHHTAVVESISADRMSLCVLQQNSSNRRYVQYGYFALGGLRAGQLHFYRAKI